MSLLNLEGSNLNKAKEILAYEVTNLIHGKEEADKATGGCKSFVWQRCKYRQYAFYRAYGR